MSLFTEQPFSEMKFGNATNLLDSDKHSLSAARAFAPFDRSIINRGSQISLFTKCFLNLWVLIIDVLILASADLSQQWSQYYKEIQILYVSVVQV